MKAIWALLCERASIDRDTNKLSLFNVIEEVTLPAQQPRSLSEALSGDIIPAVMELIVLWARSQEDVSERGFGRIRIMVPGAAPHLLPEYEVDLSKFLRLRARMRLPGIPVGETGTYIFEIEGKSTSDDWAKMFEVPLRVVVQDEDSG